MKPVQDPSSVSPSSEPPPLEAGVASADLHYWRSLVDGSDLEEQLRRIAADARVDVVSRSFARMRQRAFLFDTARLVTAACARLVYHAPDYAAGEPLEEWLDGRIDRALEDLKTQDEFEVRDKLPLDADDVRFAGLAEQLGVDVETTRSACVAFQGLPHPHRAAFWATVVDGKSIQEHAEECELTLEVAEAHLESAMEQFCLADEGRAPDPAVEEFLDQLEDLP